jgi:hypothetical protein
MSVDVENTVEDLEILDGATIVSARIAPPDPDLLREFPEYAGLASKRIVLRVKWRKGLSVNDSSMGTFEVWQDAEGNGPGYLSFVGTT